MRMISWYFTGLLTLSAMGACAPQDSVSAAANGSAPEPSRSEQVAVVPPVCSWCGVVRSINTVTQQGDSTGAGAVIGAIVGGAAGNQVGGGSGRDIATVAGAVGGVLLGNNIERNRNAVTYYEIVIDMDEGGQQIVNVPDLAGIVVGVPVSVQGGNITVR